jgi:zinc protease
MHSIYRNKRTAGRVSAVLSYVILIAALLFTGCAGLQGGAEGSAGETASGKGDPSQQQAAAPEQEDEQAQRLQLAPEVRSGTLENGLRYYVRRNGKPEDRIQLRLVVNAGSAEEEESQRGLAHFVEHMAFNGTDKYAKHAIVDYLERTGMRFGPDINAYTSFDETVYKLDLPTDEQGTVEKGLDILKEWAFHIAFNPEEVEKEKGVIVEEWRLGRGARARMRDTYWPVMMRGSRYAERLPIGKMEVVKKSSPEDLRSFYQRWYRPDNMAVIAVGDADPQEITELIEKRFGAQAAPDRPLPHTEYPGPREEELRFVKATDPEAQNTSVRIVRFHEPFVLRSRSDYRRYLARSLYRDMINNRLSEKVEQKDPPFVYGSFGMDALIRSAEASSWSAVANEGEVENALRTLKREAERVDRHGFSAGELQRAKESLRSSMQRAYEERNKTRSVRFAEEYVRLFLAGEAAPGIDREWELTQELLPEINMEDIARVHDAFTQGGRAPTVLVTGPEKEGLEYPSRKELRSVFREAEREELEPYDDSAAEEDLMSRKPDPGRIEREANVEEGDYRLFTLQNGAEVYYKQTDFKNQEILFSAFSPGGASRVETEELYAALLAPSLVSAAGLGDYPPSELRKILAGKQAKVSPYVNRLYEGFRGSARPQDMETLFQMIHLFFTAPREDEALFSSYQKRLAQVLRNRRNQPEVQLSDLVTSLLYDDHPRRQPLTAERVQELQAGQVYRLFGERFAGAGDFTFVFVGNLEPERLKQLAASYIGSLPGGDDEQWMDRGVRYVREPAEETVSAGMASKSIVRLLYSGEYDWSLEDNSLLSSLRQLLEIRLREEVREKAGGTYGVSVTAAPSRYPVEEYLLRIGFSCDPERVDELVGIIEQELQRLAEQGVGDSYVEKVRSIRSSSLEEDRKTNGFWLSFLESLNRYGLDPAELLEKEERIRAVDGKALQQAVRRYILQGTRVKAVLQPDGQ